jgi:hypothetical protein
MGDAPLATRFPRLFSICDNPTIFVAHIISDPLHSLGFRRSFGPDDHTAWEDLYSEIESFPFSENPDKIAWKLDPSGMFSVSSLYRKIIQGPLFPFAKPIWQVKIPLK